jgi:hypothetical protein
VPPQKAKRSAWLRWEQHILQPALESCQGKNIVLSAQFHKWEIFKIETSGRRAKKSQRKERLATPAAGTFYRNGKLSLTAVSPNTWLQEH